MLKEINNLLKKIKPHYKSQISFRINGCFINVKVEVYSSDKKLHNEQLQISLDDLDYNKVVNNALDAMVNRINSKL